MEYLVNIDETNRIQPYVKQNLDSLHDSNAYSRYSYAYNEAQTVMSYIGFSGYSSYANSSSNDYYKNPHLTFNKEYTGGNSYVNVDVKGYDYYSQFSTYTSTNESITNPDTAYNNNFFMAGANSFMLVPYKQPAKYGIVLKSKTIAVLDMEAYLEALKTKHRKDDDYIQVPDSEFVIKTQSESYDFVFRISRLTVVVKDDKLYIWDLSADVLTKVK